MAELPWVGPSLWRRSPRRAPPKGGELQVRVSSANAHSAQSSGTNHLAGIVDQPPCTVLPCRSPSVPSSAPRSTSRRGFPLFGGAARGRPLPFEALTPKSASKGRRAASSRILRSYSLNALRRHKSYSWGFASTSCSSPALSSTTRPSVRLEASLPQEFPSVRRSSPGSAPLLRGARRSEPLETEGRPDSDRSMSLPDPRHAHPPQWDTVQGTCSLPHRHHVQPHGCPSPTGLPLERYLWDSTMSESSTNTTSTPTLVILSNGTSARRRGRGNPADGYLRV